MQSIIDLVEQAGIELTQIGNNTYRGFCPFHDDKNTPNFTVYGDTNTAKCFSLGCSWFGDPIKFIQDFYHISREDALKKISFDDEWLKKKLLEVKKTSPYIALLIFARQVHELLKAYPEKYIEVLSILKGYNIGNLEEKYKTILGGSKNEL